MESDVVIDVKGSKGSIQLGNEWSQVDAKWLAECLVDIMVVDDAVYFDAFHSISVCNWNEPINKDELAKAVHELHNERKQKSPA